MTTRREIRMIRGNSKTLQVVARDPPPDADTAGDPIDLTGSILVFTMRRDPADGKDPHLQAVALSKTSDVVSEIEILDQETDPGVAYIELQPADTQYMDPGVYNFDVVLQTSEGKVYTVHRGQVILEANFTA